MEESDLVPEHVLRVDHAPHVEGKMIQSSPVVLEVREKDQCKLPHVILNVAVTQDLLVSTRAGFIPYPFMVHGLEELSDVPHHCLEEHIYSISHLVLQHEVRLGLVVVHPWSSFLPVSLLQHELAGVLLNDVLIVRRDHVIGGVLC
jgi:hypothetical protein